MSSGYFFRPAAGGGQIESCVCSEDRGDSDKRIGREDSIPARHFFSTRRAMRRRLFAVIAMSLGALSAVHAQDLNRSVDVSKDFAPLIESASKLPVVPDMSDTTTLKPDFRYVVTPRVWPTRFDVAPIRAARLADDLPRRVEPFYAKLGGGAPGQTIADLYLTSRRAGIFVNHRGQWADIEGVAARSITNSAGIFGDVRMGRWTLGGELTVDHDVYDDYIASGRTLTFTTPRAAVAVGNHVFGLEAEGWLPSWHGERAGRVSVGVRRSLGMHFVELRGGVGGWSADANGNTIVGITPRYVCDNQALRFVAGVEAAYDGAKDKIRAIPELEVRIYGAVSPYIRLAGALNDNSYRTLADTNPYFDPDFTFDETPGATAIHTLHAGVAGRIGRVVAWNLYAGGEMQRNMLVRSSAEPRFVDRSETFVVGVEAEAHAGGFSASLAAKYLKYNQLEGYLPSVQGSLSLNYSHGKWAVRAAVEAHDGYTFFGTETAAPVAAGIDLGAEYNFTRRLGIFVEGRNLTNQKLYPYALHRGVGASVSAGVKLKM